MILNKKDKKGLKQGLWQYNYEEGKYSIAKYKDGKLEGIKAWFDKTGLLLKEETYSAGELISYKISIYSNIIKINHLDAKGKKQGLWFQFHESGKLKSKGIYKANKKEGEWRTYHEKQLKSIENWSKGKLHGDYNTYWETGQREVTGQYIEGKKDGIWAWHEQGNPCRFLYYYIEGKEVTDEEYLKIRDNKKYKELKQISI